MELASAVADGNRATSRLRFAEDDNEIAVSCIREDHYSLRFGSPYTVPLGELFDAAHQIHCCTTVYFIADGNCRWMMTNIYDEAIARGLSILGTSDLTGDESRKCSDSVTRIWAEMHRARVLRRTLVVGVGGGVACDITGFVASTYMRGVPYALLPMTLMAQVDAAIGGKTGFNELGQKNLIGTFYNPIGVVIDPDTVRSLSDRVLAAGLAEVVKVAVIGNRELFDVVATAELEEFRTDMLLAPKVIRLAIREKLRQLSGDPMELEDLRRFLNFGHCVGHAVEAELGYTWLHGECVAAGMAVASRLGVRTGHADAADVSRIIDSLTRLGLPVNIPEEVAPAVWNHLDRIVRVRNGALHIVVPRRIGACTSLPAWPTEIAWEDVR